MKQTPIKMLILGFTALNVAGLAFAHSGAEGIVKDRMEMMGDIAKATKTIGKMVRGQTAFDGQVAKSAALEIHGHMLGMLVMFPEGSTEKPSEALPAIWENWDEFVALSDKLKADAKHLAEISSNASNADEIKAQFGLVARSCGGCHEKFRLKK